MMKSGVEWCVIVLRPTSLWDSAVPHINDTNFHEVRELLVASDDYLGLLPPPENVPKGTTQHSKSANAENMLQTV